MEYSAHFWPGSTCRYSIQSSLGMRSAWMSAAVRCSLERRRSAYKIGRFLICDYRKFASRNKNNYNLVFRAPVRRPFPARILRIFVARQCGRRYSGRTHDRAAHIFRGSPSQPALSFSLSSTPPAPFAEMIVEKVRTDAWIEWGENSPIKTPTVLNRVSHEIVALIFYRHFCRFRRTLCYGFFVIGRVVVKPIVQLSPAKGCFMDFMDRVVGGREREKEIVSDRRIKWRDRAAAMGLEHANSVRCAGETLKIENRKSKIL